MRSRICFPLFRFRPITQTDVSPTLPFGCGSAKDPTFQLCFFMQAKMPGSLAGSVRIARALPWSGGLGMFRCGQIHSSLRRNLPVAAAQLCVESVSQAIFSVLCSVGLPWSNHHEFVVLVPSLVPDRISFTSLVERPQQSFLWCFGPTVLQCLRSTLGRPLELCP